MLVLIPPDPTFWSPGFTAVWGPTGSEQARQIPATFPDGAYYIRIMRLTIDSEVGIAGSMLIVRTPFGGALQVGVEASIPPFPP